MLAVTCVACVSRPRTRCTGSMITYSLYGLHDHVLVVRADKHTHLSRLQTSSPRRLCRLRRLRRFSVPYVALRRVPPSFVSESSLCRRLHAHVDCSRLCIARASLSRRFGASGRLSSIVFTHTWAYIDLAPHALLSCPGVQPRMHRNVIKLGRTHTPRCIGYPTIHQSAKEDARQPLSRTVLPAIVSTELTK